MNGKLHNVVENIVRSFLRLGRRPRLQLAIIAMFPEPISHIGRLIVDDRV
ncbi:MAG: hypothetical protein ACLQBA_11930 [Candidatus Binataceae bacterium]